MNTKMNVLIVDDEPLAQEIIETYINNMPSLNLIAKCSNAIEANEALRNNQIDLMFLDIQMPQITGVEFLKTLQHPPMVIFTTAYSNYAIEGFELNAIDYLLKPISMDRFIKAVNKASELFDLNKKEIVEVSAGGDDFFFVKSDKKISKSKI